MNVFVRRVGWAAAALSLSFVATSAGAQALPDAKELIAKYGKAVGGDNWKAHKSARMKATMEMPGAGLRADIEAMNIFSTGVIRDFAFAMNVGAIVGVYSTTFIAAPVLIWLNDKYMAAQKRQAGRPERQGRRPMRKKDDGDSAEV